MRPQQFFKLRALDETGRQSGLSVNSLSIWKKSKKTQRPEKLSR